MAAEKNFENKIKKFLKEQGWYGNKNWGGGTFTKSGRPDLEGCVDGFYVAIEVKAEQGRPSDLQIYHLKKIDKAGGFAILLYPNQFELFKNFILCIKEGDAENTILNYQLLKERWMKYGT